MERACKESLLFIGRWRCFRQQQGSSNSEEEDVSAELEEEEEDDDWSESEEDSSEEEEGSMVPPFDISVEAALAMSSACTSYLTRIRQLDEERSQLQHSTPSSAGVGATVAKSKAHDSGGGVDKGSHSLPVNSSITAGELAKTVRYRYYRTDFNVFARTASGWAFLPSPPLLP